MKFGEIVKEHRGQLGISQQRLAELSGLSIATIQVIESGRGNPTLEILEKISKVLSLNVEVISKKTNWDLLCNYGLGLTSESKDKTPLQPKKLPQLLTSACLELKNSNGIYDKERYLVATEALVLAIKNHYPTFFKTHVDIPIIKYFIPKKITGKHIKLYRYSKGVLGTYL